MVPALSYPPEAQYSMCSGSLSEMGETTVLQPECLAHCPQPRAILAVSQPDLKRALNLLGKDIATNEGLSRVHKRRAPDRRSIDIGDHVF